MNNFCRKCGEPIDNDARYCAVCAVLAQPDPAQVLGEGGQGEVAALLQRAESGFRMIPMPWWEAEETMPLIREIRAALQQQAMLAARYRQALEAIACNDSNDLGVYARFAEETAAEALREGEG